MTIGPSIRTIPTHGSTRLSHTAAATLEPIAYEREVLATDDKGKARAFPSTASKSVSELATKHDVIQYLTGKRGPLPYFRVLRRLEQLDLRDDPAILNLIIALALERHPTKVVFISLKQLVNSRKAHRADVVRTFERTAAQLQSRHKWDVLLAVTGLALSNGLVTSNLIKARMSALYKLQRFMVCVETFELFRQYGIAADGEAYDELVGAHLLAGNLDAAQTVLNSKSELGFPTTTKTILSLIDGMWLYGGNTAMEAKVLNERAVVDLARQQALCQDPRVLHRIMSVRAARGDYEDALAVLPFFNLDSDTALAATTRRFIDRDQVSSPHSYARPRLDLTTVGILMGIATRKGLHELSQQLLVDSQRCGLGLNETVVNAFVKDLLAKDGIKQATEFVDDLQQGRAVLHDATDPTSFVTLPPFRLCRLVKETIFHAMLMRLGPGSATAFLTSTARHGGRLLTKGMLSGIVDWVTRHRHLTSLTSARLVTRAYEMVSSSIKPTPRDYNRLLEAAWREERAKSSNKNGRSTARSHEANSLAVDLSSAIGGRSSADYQTVFNAFRLQSMSAPADHLWEFMQISMLDRGMRPKARHMTTVIMAYIRLGNAEGAERALNYGLKALNVRPHVSMFTALIDGLSKLGQHDRAMHVYQQLKRDYLYRHSGGQLPNGSGDTNETETVKEQAVFKDDFVRMDRHGFATLCMVCARQRDVRGVQLVWDQARQTLSDSTRDNVDRDPSAPRLPPVELDPVFVSIMYRVLCMTNQIAQAQQLIDNKLDRGLVPDDVLIKMLDRTRRWTRRKINSSQKSVTTSSLSSVVSIDDLEELQNRSDKVWDKARKVQARHASERTGVTIKGGETAAWKKVKNLVQSAQR
ncbi:hypothetical protein OIV83_000052 [Microbotryomycetes sp. JL201]|nr:hypothetical protein OIV83_000052 [Microbotryomycetes sp. JL201]